jgi:hypothetical protein
MEGLKGSSFSFMFGNSLSAPLSERTIPLEGESKGDFFGLLVIHKD